MVKTQEKSPQWDKTKEKEKERTPVNKEMAKAIATAKKAAIVERSTKNACDPVKS